METVIIAFSALLASTLTFFSGFGLGTLLMPVVAIFLPVDIAIGITAMVHFLNNIFKLGLVGLKANKEIVFKFGIPAVFAAFFGAALLGWLAASSPLITYPLWGNIYQVTPIKSIVGIVIIIFVIMELFPFFATITFNRKFLPIGGCLSGFFGGLSGLQGAFRSMFLLKLGLNKEQFIATGIVVAVMVDLARILVYGWNTTVKHPSIDWLLVVVVTCSAFIGTFVGSQLIKKITFRSIQMMVSSLLIIVATGLVSGIL